MTRSINILLVEDNPGDIRLTREALKESIVPHELSVVGDGAAAIHYLERATAEGPGAMPDLVLLDLNLPKLNGHEVLQRIKSHDQWKVIPVVVLTTSEAEADIIACYAEHANCYISKPLALHTFMDVVKQIQEFWLSIVHLPRT
jgi:two-component system, chemotaxis family, response regulator Rcp1